MTVPATTHLRSTVSTGSGVVAHRGASAEFPELTLVAYEKALEQGAEALEVDVRLTSDGVPVLLHDPGPRAWRTATSGSTPAPWTSCPPSTWAPGIRYIAGPNHSSRCAVSW